MRLTHTSAIRGFATLSAGAAMFASAMLASPGVANAAPVTSPEQAAALAAATPAQPQIVQQDGDHHCKWHKHGKKHWGDFKNDKDGIKVKDDGHKGKDGKDHEKKWGDDHKKWSDDGKDHEKKWDKEKDHGYGSDSVDGDLSGYGDHCKMPVGSVESGLGGTALSSSQSPATTVSLGALSALMLGSGVWTVFRSRRTRVQSVTR